MPHQSLQSINAVVAFIENDIAFAAKTITNLEEFGFRVIHFQTGEDCLKDLQNISFDIFLFNTELPGISGSEIIQQLKNLSYMPPTIIMTNTDAEENVVKILEAGADDYIIKPPNLAILNAKIQALLRRSRITSSEKKVRIGNISIDYEKNQIYLKGIPAKLTNKEMMLAFTLFQHRGKIISRKDLQVVIDNKERAIETRNLDVHISRLRSKLELNAANGWRLSSIYQRGYRLDYIWEG